MKYREGLIPKTKTQLRDSMSNVMLRAPQRQFPEWEDFDGVFHSLACGVENLQNKLGTGKSGQLLDMLSTAKAHYEAGNNKLGGALMEDAKMVVMNRQPWAYPKELYRWGRDPALPELTESDILNKEVEGD
jgi:hypothetical protein